MIVRETPRLRDVLTALRGSILPRIVRPLALIVAVSIGAVVLSAAAPALLADLAPMPFTLIGIALSIFMSFRNTVCYNRWWEGRQLWGRLIIATRSFARQLATLERGDAAPLLETVAGFVAGLGARLREEDETRAITGLAGNGPWATAPNPTDAALSAVGQACRQLTDAGVIDAMHYTVLEIQLSEMASVQGGCERIKATPVPFSYSLLLHRTAYAFCLLLPFALATTLHWWTIVPVFLVSYAFFGLDALGDELGDPFGTDENDLPLSAMVRTMERELLHAAGHAALPPALEPRDFVLH
ncbi:bestrophin [Novosphingobium profundi]|uniref:bestrophin family protein n=1 Tax=Novosphingobium profundi TaxID=1774954 RepID=UPI001BDB31EA|nr:bestrophin family protein [Novosphingobium profundi]MBT0670047.1 bestrophin [Novosphingobium profundi]